jgi:hypothetical protein
MIYAILAIYATLATPETKGSDLEAVSQLRSTETRSA